MKLTVFLMSLSVGILHAANTYSQSARLSLEMTNMPIQAVLDKIEDQSDFNFFYNNKQIDTEQLVTVKKQNADVFAVLDELFANTNVVYKALDKSIILSTDANKIFSVQQDRNSIRIAGVVVDNNEEPIVGANVVEKGTTNGVITDAEGRFSLTVSSGAVLQISFIGYITQEVGNLSARDARGGVKP